MFQFIRKEELSTSLKMFLALVNFIFGNSFRYSKGPIGGAGKVSRGGGGDYWDLKSLGGWVPSCLLYTKANEFVD